MDVFTDITSWEAECITYLKQIHPDVCTEPNSAAATAKLLQFKSDLENGITHKDDAGSITYFPSKGIIKSIEPLLLPRSLMYYNIIFNLADDFWKKYIPTTYVPAAYTLSVTHQLEDRLEFTFPERAIPLSSVGVLDQVHVNWILKRLFEFTAWLHNQGYIHNGLTPDSVYIVPQSHGIVINSFYHMCKTGYKLRSISGRYAHFYPEVTFSAQHAVEEIDIELIKRIGAYLLGDESGNGSKFKKTHCAPFIDFLLRYDTNSSTCYVEFRELIAKNFKKHFYPLNI